jgi:1,4-alpha-glucan branching enzyme
MTPKTPKTSTVQASDKLPSAVASKAPRAVKPKATKEPVSESTSQAITVTSKAPKAPKVPMAKPPVAVTSSVTGQLPGELDIHLFREGTHPHLFRFLGCQLTSEGAHFAVWAPDARSVSVIGDFNGWQAGANPAQARSDHSGLWEVSIPGVFRGQNYKYAIQTRAGDWLEKADPFARMAELPPATGSVVWGNGDYTWNDDTWLHARKSNDALSSPMSVYELHLGSWRRSADGALPDYRSIAPTLAAYVKELGFTHVELMPITEHPFYGSWGYQTTGYFAATSRYGTPDDFKFLVDTLHGAGIGVILDWVPSHFPADAHGLAQFDGTHLYEHADPRQGFHPEWNSLIFNYGRNEVRSFLLSSALFWLEEFHIDALRVDAVASMLYLDYSRKEGEWIPNHHGGRENLEAISFLQLLNRTAYREHPGVQVIAEESTAWPQVTGFTENGGLGFGMKWNMGWMHDTLKYMQEDPINRRWHHGTLTFSMVYAFTENFMLPLSHDEVVYGKGSLINKMPGDEWQQFANLRLLLGHMWAHPGKKLLFMGGEFGQRAEWTHEGSLDWAALDRPLHAGLQRWVADLNRLYRDKLALHELDFTPNGFEWIASDAADTSVLMFMRKAKTGAPLLVVANFTPVPRENVLVGVPLPGLWREVLNSDAADYGGSGVGNFAQVSTVPVTSHGRFQALNMRLPPLGILILEHAGDMA